MRIKRAAKDMLALSLRAVGAASLSDPMKRRDQFGILVYHNPSPEVLDTHLAFLGRRYAFSTLDTMVDCIDEGGYGGPASLVVTIDDGHVGNYALAHVFLQHGVRPTIFICSSIVGTGRMFWWQHPAAKEIGVERLKRMRNDKRLICLKKLGYSPTAEWPQRAALSRSDIEYLIEFADVQSHTRFHPILTQCDDTECVDEIATSKSEVEALTGRPCQHFAFPNGNYDRRLAGLLRQCGYRSARTLDLGWNSKDADRLSLTSIPIADNASLPWLEAQLTTIPAYIKYMTHGSFNGRFPQF